MSTITDLTLFLFFTFELILIFLKVAISLPVPEVVFNPLTVSSLPPFEKTSLSGLRLSVIPLLVIRAYLSSSYERKVSSDSAIITFVELLLIVTSNCLLIVNEELVKSIDAIFLFGNVVYNVLSLDDWKLEYKILKSLGFMIEDGKAPSHTPETVVIPEIVIEL